MNKAPLEGAREIIKTLTEEGHKAYIAGGWVRDFLMHNPSDDIDIATSATVEEIQKLFPKTLLVGAQFGIVVVVHEGHQFEVATFRTEADYKDGRRPQHVDTGTLEEDAQRRDFTINGMYYDIQKEEVIDLVRGKEDLQKKIIRAIGDANERIGEDRLRMVRAIRYAIRFHFQIDEKTKEAIRTHATELFPAVSVERVVSELQKMAAFSDIRDGILELQQFGLLDEIFPQLKGTTEDQLREKMSNVPYYPENAPLVAILFTLFEPSSLEEKWQLCDQLKLSNKDRKFAEHLQAWQETNMKDLYRWTELYAYPDSDLCLEITALTNDDREEYINTHYRQQKRLQEAIERRRQNKTLITAAMLQEKGIEPGKRMGELIKEGEKISVQQHISDPQKVLSLILH